MNEYELLCVLRQSPLATGTKFIALTGFGKATDKALAQEAGFDLHFTKPVNTMDLCEKTLAGLHFFRRNGI